MRKGGGSSEVGKTKDGYDYSIPFLFLGTDMFDYSWAQTCA